KSHLIKDCDVYDIVDTFPSVVLKVASVPASSRNSSASTSAGRSIPAASKNRPASIHADRSIHAASRNRPASIHADRSIPAASRNRPASIHAGRHIPAGRINKPAPFPDGRSVPTGWTNHAARPFFRPTNLYFDNVFWPGIYDHMSMNEGRWGFAVKSSAESECDEHVILVPSFTSNSFSGPKVHDISAPMENNLDYAEELARLQRQEHEAHSAAVNIVSAGGVPAGSIPAEPSSVAKALADPDWVAAMQEEMWQFYNQQVWKLVPLPAGKIAIGTKWILKNKRDARGIVVRNKARLVAQGHRQEGGIDYDEVFTPVARIEAIRLFLAFASYMGFMVYQMDVKSAFLYREIEEEVYVTQLKGFEDPRNPRHVYRVVKALYGLHQASRAWYARLSTFLLKHHYRRGTIDKTLFLKKDSRHIILVQVYVDDIIFGSMNKAWCDEFEMLMKGEFEMSAMGELTFFLGLQVKQLPDEIFISQDKYVKDMLKKFDMESVRTATTPYECKKQTVVATSFTEAEYVAAASCCGQSTICIVKNLVFHQRTKHIEIRHHFIRDANEKNLIQVYVYILTHSCRLYLVYCKMTTVSCGFLLYAVQIIGRPPILLGVPVFLLVVLVPADGWVSTGSCIIPTGSGTIPTGSSTIPTGSSTIPTGSCTLPTGSCIIPTGSSTIPTGSCTLPTGSYSFMLLGWFLLVVTLFLLVIFGSWCLFKRPNTVLDQLNF
nr:retrovirus-related Pol polyprotein from transposon TNT 1-94 [Tanacetum cinerariifolium]